MQPELKSDRFPATVLFFFPVSKPEEMLHGAAGSSRKVFVDVCSPAESQICDGNAGSAQEQPMSLPEGLMY